MLAIFEKYSQTKEKGKIQPLYLKFSPSLAYDKIMLFLKDQQIVGLEGNKDFFDIYFSQFGFEYSIVIIQNEDGASSLNISVFGENKRGRTRKKLKQFCDLLKEKFSNYLA